MGSVESILTAPARREEPGVRPAPGERALIRRAQRGSQRAAGELFARHWPGAWRAALAITGRRAAADDVAQDAFERAFANLDRFDPARPFAPWLHRIVVNRALDLLRAERRLVPVAHVPETLIAWSAADAPDPQALAALATLSEDRRTVIVLRHLLDHSPAEIADLLDLPVGTVHSRLARALAELRDLLGTNDE